MTIFNKIILFFISITFLILWGLIIQVITILGYVDQFLPQALALWIAIAWVIIIFSLTISFSILLIAYVFFRGKSIT